MLDQALYTYMICFASPTTSIEEGSPENMCEKEKSLPDTLSKEVRGYPRHHPWTSRAAQVGMIVMT
ncbi:unnamed protein product [Penicillium camemberti]|uniref:Str. FM013 n=1 Tax=Penicillium camemberti (strain FM 013) TaxID=1429867 RepID=A0A0G4P1B8_PENC3|nr:unnamed protein product [Penicillium camemberti]